MRADEVIGTQSYLVAGAPLPFLSGGGAMGALMRAHDWSASPLGAPEGWPQSLRTTVSLMLNSRYPMFVAWGPRLAFLYNDGYAPIFGRKHPGALGLPFEEVWAEIWDDVRPLVDRALAGEATYNENLHLVMERNGYPEDTWYTFSYSPVRDESGGVGGMFCACHETTAQVKSDRALRDSEERLRVLDALSTATARLVDADAILATTTRLVGEHLNVSVCAYADMDEDQDGFTIRGDWAAPGSTSIVGHYSLADFGRLAVANLGAGRPLVVNDNLKELAPEEAATFQSIGIAATICMPLVKDGRLTALMAIHDRAPRVWTERELALLREVTERSWAHVERVGAVAAVRASERELRMLTDGLPVLVSYVDADERYRFNNKAYEDWFGRRREDLHGQLMRDVLGEAAYDMLEPRIKAALSGERSSFEQRVPYRDGGPRDVHVDYVPRFGAGGVEGFYVLVEDIGRQKRAEDELRASEALSEYLAAQQAATLSQLAEGVIVTDESGRIRLVNDAAARLHGVARLDVAPDEYSATYSLLTEDGEPYPSLDLPLARAVRGEPVMEERWRIRRPDGTEVLAIGNAKPVLDEAGRQIGAVLTVRDDTERTEAEIAMRALNETLEQRVEERTRDLLAAEEALRQSQKMEAVGQLTGGIAHDFNNMLSVVIGSLDLLGRRLPPADARSRRHVDSAMEGARRAATLTQRLLAFSRQQPLKPEPLDPNRLVAGMSDLLRHSIGADIRLETVLAGGLWLVKADPNQLENVVLNLAVNARDAMPSGGRLTIETQNAHLDPRYAAAHPGVPAGQYVMVAVTDTGAGMAPDIIAKAFDPFFTTKEVGKGTGLGLSQVYGFVRQSGGHVKVYSETGQGTTVKVYLPRLVGTPLGTAPEAGSADAPLGDREELVLVVEDEQAVRQFSVEALGELGYRVIEADGAAAALRLLEAHPDIALMFTDIVMPDVNGRRLADEARRLRPDLKVLFTTGYTRNAVVHNGVVDPGVELIGKPFTLDELANKVRDMLDKPGGG